MAENEILARADFSTLHCSAPFPSQVKGSSVSWFSGGPDVDGRKGVPGQTWRGRDGIVGPEMVEQVSNTN